MLNRIFRGLTLAALTGVMWIAPQRCYAQATTSDDDDDPCAGFMPSKKMMNLWVDRATDDMGRQYHMSDEQLAQTRQLFKEHVVTFISKNRDTIRPLLNQFIESQLSETPPTPEDVAQWSQKALPLMTQLDDVVSTMGDKMKSFFNDDQAAKLDGEMAAFRGGFTLVTGKLNSWAQGNYDPETEWTSPASQARKQRDREEAAKIEAEAQAAKAESNERWAKYKEEAGNNGVAAAGAETEPGPTEVVVKPAEKPTAPVATAKKDDWERHVDAFVAKYNLDSDQKQKAYARLHEAQQQRDDYLRSKTGEIDRISATMKNAKTEDERKKAQDEFEHLNAPVTRRFDQLTTYLNTLPTRKQRQDADKNVPASTAESKPKAVEKIGAEH